MDKSGQDAEEDDGTHAWKGYEKVYYSRNEDFWEG